MYSLSGIISDSAAVRDGEVYYLEENRIMKWNQGDPEVFCEYDGKDIYGFLFMNDDAIVLVRQNNYDIYYLDGQFYEDISKVETQKVIMLDGSKQFASRMTDLFGLAVQRRITRQRCLQQFLKYFSLLFQASHL